MKLRRLLVSLCVASACTLPAISQPQLQTLAPSASDTAAAQRAHTTRHALPAHTAKGAALRHTLPNSIRTDVVISGARRTDRTHLYPGDLTYNGGATLDFAESHAVFVTGSKRCSTPACWGHPMEFLQDFGKSEMSHLTDQYVGVHSHDRYTIGASFQLNRPVTRKPMTEVNIVAIAHAAASKGGFSGYHHILHIFLSPGQNVCTDSSYTDCYSPDHFDSFAFCGYHGSADFDDIGHVLYTVEPYQNVDGCKVTHHTPNGEVEDSTNNVLSHELIETITDPDGTAWFNINSLPMLYDEIGDECQLVSLDEGTFAPLNVRLNGKLYAIQPEYSNSAHTCTTLP